MQNLLPIFFRPILFFCTLAGPALAQPLTPGPVPVVPTLIENRAPDLCGPFLEAWQDVFAQNNYLRESELDLKNAFPDAEILSPTSNKPLYRLLMALLHKSADGIHSMNPV